MVTIQESYYPFDMNLKVMPLHCEDCGETISLVLPMKASTVACLMRAFEDAHCECVLDHKEKSEDE